VCPRGEPDSAHADEGPDGPDGRIAPIVRLPAGAPARIAVLGAGGFIGSHLVPALLQRFPRATIDAVDIRLDKLDASSSSSPRVRRIEARMDSPGLLDTLSAGCEVIFSLTALCNPALYNTQPLEVIDASYTDLVPLVKLCAARGRWLIHLSTCEVYGREALDGDGHPMTEMREDETALFLGPVHKQRWCYAAAKQLLERLMWAHGLHSGLKFTIVRPFNVIGPRMDFVPGVDGEGIPRVLASFIHALLTGGELTLVDGGSQRRSFLYVTELVDALTRILERPGECHGEIINLGNPQNDITMRALAEALIACYRARRPNAAPARMREMTAESFYGSGYDDSVVRIPSIAKAERLLDWRPTSTLAEMLPAIVDDYLAHYEPLLQAAVEAARVRGDGAARKATP
jgi:UDP-apiose/xylose synthase